MFTALLECLAIAGIILLLPTIFFVCWRLDRRDRANYQNALANRQSRKVGKAKRRLRKKRERRTNRHVKELERAKRKTSRLTGEIRKDSDEN